MANIVALAGEIKTLIGPARHRYRPQATAAEQAKKKDARLCATEATENRPSKVLASARVPGERRSCYHHLGLTVCCLPACPDMGLAAERIFTFRSHWRTEMRLMRNEINLVLTRRLDTVSLPHLRKRARAKKMRKKRVLE